MGAGFEVPAHVVSATLEAVRGLQLVPGFRVRLPSDPDKEAHPTFVKGTGRNPAFLRWRATTTPHHAPVLGTRTRLFIRPIVCSYRDFADSLVMAAEATLSRDAAAAPLAKGRARLPEQVALRQHLGLPKGNAAGRARLRARDFVRRPPCALATCELEAVSPVSWPAYGQAAVREADQDSFCHRG